MKLKLLALVLGLQVAWILATVTTQELNLRSAPTVLLETRPVDPRDMLRGDYVILSYKISGVIWNYLASSTKAGRLFSVVVNTGASDEVLPVFIPAEFNSVNIQKGQHFNFSVEVDDKGILTVKGLIKT